MRAMRSRSVRSETVVTAPSILLRVIHGTRFPDDGDFDLARIFQLVSDATGDLLRHPHGLPVRAPLAFDQDADLAPCLQPKRLRHALERVSDAFELLKPFD